MNDMAPNPNPGATVEQSKAGLDTLVKELMAKVSAPHMGMPQPQQRASQEQLTPQGYDTHHESNPNADKGQVMANVGTFIHNMVAQHKQNQIRDAVSEWQGLDRALEKAQVLAGDPSAPDYKEKVHKALAEDPFVKANLDPSNPKAVKRLKNMYKALNVDMLDDKENVHRQGLSKMFKLKEAFAKVTGNQKKLQEYKQQQQSQQQTPQQRTEGLNSAISSMMNKAAVQGPDPKAMAEAVQKGIDLKKAEQEKFEFKQGIDPETGKPTWFSFDKTNPNAPAKRVEIDGKAIGAESKFSAAQYGKVLSIGSKPYGVASAHGVLSPGDPDWGEKEARNYDAANKAYAAQEADKEKNTRLRAQTYLASREYGVIWNKPDGTKVLTEVGPQVINAAPPGTYSPAGAGMQAMGRESKFQDIYWNIDNVETAAKELKSNFDAKTRAQMIAAMHSEDAGAVTTFAKSLVAQHMPEDVINYVTAIGSLRENSMALATLGGYGQGSDAVRAAIDATVPNVGTPSQAYLQRQLTLLRGTTKRLEKGVPAMGAQGDPISDPNKVPD